MWISSAKKVPSAPVDSALLGASPTDTRMAETSSEAYLESKQSKAMIGLEIDEGPYSRRIAVDSAVMRSKRKKRKNMNSRGSNLHLLHSPVSLVALFIASLVLLATTLPSTVAANLSAGTTSSGLRYGWIERRHPSQHKDRLLQTNNSEETNQERVKINKFNVELTNANSDLSSSDRDALHGICEAVIENYMLQQKIDPTKITVDYLYLREISSVRSGSQTTLMFTGGVVNFSDLQSGDGEKIPSKEYVNEWVKEAINSVLAIALQETSSFSYVQTATYVELVPNVIPEDPPGNSVGDDGNPSTSDGDGKSDAPGIVQEPWQASTPTSDPDNTGAIVGSVIAGVVLVSLLAFFVYRRRQSGQEKYFEHPQDGEIVHHNSLQLKEEGMEDNSTLNISQETEAELPPPPGALLKMNSVPDDGRSLAGSESDFTVNTEAGDSAALKSLSHAIPEDIGTGAVVGTQRAVHTESFERERPINLRKDMLTTSWSGHVYGGGMSNTRSAQNDSVLTPSHFSASEERQQRKQQVSEAGTMSDKSSTVRSDGSRPQDGKESSLVFEQANEETDVRDGGVQMLMTPPSQTSRFRAAPSASDTEIV